MTGPRAIVVGVLADTHGLLRPEAVAALRGADLIVHAGDVGSSDVLEALRGLAPLHAVRGNNDRGPWADALPENLTLRVGGVALHVLHDRKSLALDPRAHGIGVVIAGHSHRPLCERHDGVLHLNPGSCGPRRFHLPVTLARLRVRGSAVAARILTLACAPTAVSRVTIPGARARVSSDHSRPRASFRGSVSNPEPSKAHRRL